MSTILYGASLTYKSSIAKIIQPDANRRLTISNSTLIDYAGKFYSDNAEQAKSALVQRCAAMEVLESFNKDNMCYDRGLLDQYVWCHIYGAKGLPSIPEIMSIEDNLINVNEVTNRRLIINEDYDHIEKVLTDPKRLIYLGCNNIDSFIVKCDRFNRMFNAMFPQVKVILIKDMKSQLCNEIGELNYDKVMSTLELI